jgi:hypothetical protein
MNTRERFQHYALVISSCSDACEIRIAFRISERANPIEGFRSDEYEPPAAWKGGSIPHLFKQTCHTSRIYRELVASTQHMLLGDYVVKLFQNKTAL